MRVSVLDGFEGESVIAGAVQEVLKERGVEHFYFTLREMNLLPCRACGSCGLRTPGECVLKDEIPEIMKALARSTTMVLLTPVRFGGYSSQLKRALDRFMLLGLPLYMVRNGQLLHPARYDIRSLLAVGLKEENLEGQEENFRKLVAANARNLHLEHRALIVGPAERFGDIKHAVENSLREVYGRG